MKATPKPSAAVAAGGSAPPPAPPPQSAAPGLAWKEPAAQARQAAAASPGWW